jgi:hypothetical protein
MKDTAVAAANELGRLPRDKWEEEANKGDPDNGIRGFLKVMGAEQPKTLAIILARILPKPDHVCGDPYDDFETHDDGMSDVGAAASVRVRMPATTANNRMFINDSPRRSPGRPPGSVNKMGRRLQEAAIAAAEELGGIDRDKWGEEARKGDPDNGLKGFFKVIAVEEARTFLLILARMLPKLQPAKEPRSPSHRAAKVSHPSDQWSR